MARGDTGRSWLLLVTLGIGDAHVEVAVPVVAAGRGAEGLLRDTSVRVQPGTGRAPGHRRRVTAFPERL